MKPPVAVMNYYGRKFAEAFFNNITYDPMSVTAVDDAVQNVVINAAERAAAEYNERRPGELPPPIESLSLEQDITNFETRGFAGVPSGELGARLVAILRRINREKGASFPIPIIPLPSPVIPVIPSPMPLGTIICKGNTVEGENTFSSSAFYRPEKRTVPGVETVKDATGDSSYEG